MIIVYFDGACEPTNPGGIATYGYIIYNGDTKVYSGSGIATKPFTRQATNNLAEYTALLKALEYLYDNNYTHSEIQVYGDSQLAIRQLNGIYSVRSHNIIPLYKRVKQLEKTFKNISYNWIPREKNIEADELSHQAYIDYLKNHPDIVEQLKPLLATRKQKQLLQKLGVPLYDYMGKREASRLIQRYMK